MASRIGSKYLATALRAPRVVSPSVLRPYPRLPRTLQPSTQRFAHAIPRPTIPAQDGSSSSPSAADANTPRKQLEPHYQLTFTCVPCAGRSTHIVSKQGYHKGSVLITCPSCRNRHVISDNLNIFGNRKITVEDLLREKGQLVKRGTLGEDGDVEFWADETTEESAVGEATAAQDGANDEAMRMRETRDPSSQATNPTPSASGLPGDAGSTRPSMQGATYQNTTPSTRRQYSTNASRDSSLWQHHLESTRQRSLARESEIRNTTSTKAEESFPAESYSGETRSDISNEFDVRRGENPFIPRTETRSPGINTASPQEIQSLRSTMSSDNPSEPHDFPVPRRYRTRNTWRKVLCETEYNGPRFIRSHHPTKITAQITPGVVSYFRPPRGEPALKRPVPDMKRSGTKFGRGQDIFRSRTDS